MLKKIQISESKLYEIIKQTLIEQEENKKIVEFSPEQFKSFILTKNYEKFINVLNSNYDEVIVEGTLNLKNSQIESLPNNLVVLGGLNLANTKIKKIPDNLFVRHSLSLENTLIQNIPENLKLGGNLWLENTLVDSLPDNFDFEGNIFITGTPLWSKFLDVTEGRKLKEKYYGKKFNIVF